MYLIYTTVCFSENVDIGGIFYSIVNGCWCNDAWVFPKIVHNRHWIIDETSMIRSQSQEFW